jgi:hypothetical protein
MSDQDLNSTDADSPALVAKAPRSDAQNLLIGCSLSVVVGIVSVLVMITMRPPADSQYDAKEAVRARLKDPSSAQFGDITKYMDGDKPRAYCGTVNARTGFGGYGGFQRFIRLPNTDMVYMEEEAAGVFQGFWTRYCHD